MSDFVEVYAAGTAAMLVQVQSVERRSTGEVIRYAVDYAAPTCIFAQRYHAVWCAAGVVSGPVELDAGSGAAPALDQVSSVL